MSDLFKAVLDRDVVRVDRLVADGVGMEERDSLGRSPLMEATIEGSEAIVRSLSQAGADPNAKDREGFTALHFAAQNYQLGIARILIASGATVDAVDVYGSTPLWRAVFASRGHGEMIRLLLDAGADRNLQNASGVSALDLAVTIGNYDVKQFFATPGTP